MKNFQFIISKIFASHQIKPFENNYKLGVPTAGAVGVLSALHGSLLPSLTQINSPQKKIAFNTNPQNSIQIKYPWPNKILHKQK